MFERLRDSQGISSGVITVECSSLAWNKRIFPFGDMSKHLVFTDVEMASYENTILTLRKVKI